MENHAPARPSPVRLVPTRLIPTLLMGDPAHFSVVGGANPHTRDRWGQRKGVDRARAIRQWNALKSLMEDHAFRVVVIPPDAARPGLVYPANAGARIGGDFLLSRLTPTRAAEEEVYARVVSFLGLHLRSLAHRFEGEADLFPAGSHYIFTSGALERQRFAPRWGIPPWKRIYGFRSAPAALDEIITQTQLPRPVLRLTLVDEAFYHGDTCLCAFGKDRGDLLYWGEALAPASADLVRRTYGERAIPLDRADGEIYAANSFSFERGGRSYLVVPKGISEDLAARIAERGVEILPVDVTEFHKKGGGSVKCMIGDLGLLDEGGVS